MGIILILLPKQWLSRRKNVDNLWTNINDNIPMYMNEICKEHKLECVKVSPLKTAMIGDEFAIMIAIDRFDIEIYYLYKKDRDKVKYPCGSFLHKHMIVTIEKIC